MLQPKLFFYNALYFLFDYEMNTKIIVTQILLKFETLYQKYPALVPQLFASNYPCCRTLEKPFCADFRGSVNETLFQNGLIA
jgi:hypothetical protein